MKEKNTPNAKKKEKIAENTFPKITETAELKYSFTLNAKFAIENEEIDEDEGIGRDGYA